jgi:RecB family exonuclease
MKIELYLVPPGNKDFRKTLTEKALEGLEGPDYSGILYLSPTRHMINTWQKEFHPAAGACYIPPRTATLRGLSRRMYASNGGGVLIDQELAPLAIAGITGHGIGFSKVLADFIGDIKNHFPGEGVDSIRQKFIDIFGELFIPEEVSKRVFDALEVFTRYAEALKAAGIADGDDALLLSTALVEGQKGADVLILDGFYEVTPAEWQFIRALIGRATKTLISIPISDAGDDLSHCYSRFIEKEYGVTPDVRPSPSKPPVLDYVAAQSREEELEGIARHIKSSFVSGKLKELDHAYVAFPKLSEYREMLDRVFKRYGIPYTPQPPVRKPYRHLLSLVESVRDGFPRLATARFLTSPYFEGIPEGIRMAIPKIALEAGTVSGKDSWLRALESHGLNKEGTKLFENISPLFSADNTGTYAGFIDNLLKVSRTLSFTPGEEQPDGLEGVLRGLSALDSIPGIKPTGLHGFSEALASYLEFQGSGEREAAGVHVADLRELRGLEPENLYLGGLEDGDLPARPEIDFLLPDSVRARLGFVDMHRYLRLQGYIFKRLVSSAGHLRLSYPSMEGDKLFLPSLYLRGAQETPERIFGDFSPEEEMTRQAGKPLAVHINEISGIKRYRGSSPLRVTDIDSYRSCPRRFFIEKVLGIEPPELREYEVDPKTIGIIVHEVMEKLIGPPLDGMDAFRRRAEKAVDKVLDAKPLDSYFKALLKESFLTVLPDIFEIEEGLASEGYAPKKAEYSIKGEPLPGIKLKGKIDRIDVRDGGSALVLDYKTGATNLSSTGTLKRGETLQPFIYSALLKAEGARNPESVGIYSLKDLRIKRVPDRKDVKEGRTLEHFIETALLYLDSTVSAMRDGDFKAHPLSDATCRQCHERPYCPYMQGDAK